MRRLDGRPGQDDVGVTARGPFLYRSGPLELLEGMPDCTRAAALAAKIREGP